MNCPYCGAELQENARFCLYCMKSLQEKQPIKVPAAKKRLYWIIPVIAAAAAIAVGLFFLLRQEAAAPTKPAQLTVNSELPPITDPGAFYFAAVSESERLEANDLWEPSYMWFPEEARAVVPLSLPDADCQILFLEDGRAIFAAVSNLTEETLAGGQRIAECICAAVYDGIADAPSLRTNLPMEAAESSLTELLKLDDPAGAGTTTGVARCRLEPKSYGREQQTLLCELRTRSCEDGAYYDIFLYFGQE